MALIVIMALIVTIPIEVPGQGFGGYVSRVGIKPQFMNNEDIIIECVAFRSSIDNKVISENIIVHVYIGREINGTPQSMDPYHNQTITGSAKKTKINLGRMDLGTYRIIVDFIFPDGENIEYEYTFLVSHIPIKYSLVFLNDGKEIYFESKEKGKSFDVEIWVNTGQSANVIKAYSNITKKSIKLNSEELRGAISITVYITDYYNWTNAGDCDHTYFYTVSKMDFYYTLISVMIMWGIGVGIMVTIWKKSKKRRSKE